MFCFYFIIIVIIIIVIIIIIIIIIYFFFQIAKTRNLRVLLTRRENAVLGNIFTHLCCNYDTNHTDP